MVGVGGDGQIRVSKKKNPKTKRRTSSSSTTSASWCSSSGGTKWGSDRMVEVELDAARALADFAQLAMLGSGSGSAGGGGGGGGGGGTTAATGESDRKWGNKGRRSVKRTKTTDSSSHSEWGRSIDNLTLRSSDAVQDVMVENNKSHKKDCESAGVRENARVSENARVREKLNARTVKDEHDPEILKSRPLCSMSGSWGGSRSKNQLTEAEKEARRLRRILANRESARQTIRRRQAVCEELTKKAAALELDNESLKREKELALKEYQLLLDINKQLKMKIDGAEKTEVEEVRVEVPATDIKAEISSEKPPLLVYNSPVFSPFVWPSIIQSLNPIHNQPIPPNTATSQGPIPSTYQLHPPHEQGNPVGAIGPRPPFYIVPYPLFFPLPEQGNRLFSHPQDFSGSRDKQQGDTSGDNLREIGSSSLKAIKVENNQAQPSLPRKVAAETCDPRQASPTKNVHETSTRPNNGERHLRGKSLMPSPLGSHKSSAIIGKCENMAQQNSVPKEESASSTSGHSTTAAFPESIMGQSVNPSKVDAAAAAEARKRRKELTKLKNINGRQQHLLRFTN